LLANYAQDWAVQHNAMSLTKSKIKKETTAEWVLCLCQSSHMATPILCNKNFVELSLLLDVEIYAVRQPNNYEFLAILQPREQTVT